MKKIKLILIAFVIFSSVSFIQQAVAQEKSSSEVEKELKLQQLIEEQKKAMIEQKAAQAEAEEQIKESESDIEDALNDMEVRVESSGRGGNSIRVITPRSNRSFSYDEPFIFAGSPGIENFYGHSYGGETERTTWDFSKSVKENTFSRNYSFDVEKSAKSVSMSVMGDCKAGDIRIKIIMPNGKSYSEIVIDEFGNLNWRKSFSITETENQDKTGEWKFQISSNKATGFFKISLQTF